MPCDKKRTTRWAGSKWTAWLLGSLALQQCQLGSLTAWQLGCATVAAWLLDGLVARQLGCLTTGRLNNCRHQLAHILYHSKGLDQLPWKGLDRGSGSEVWIVCGTGAWSRPYILSRICEMWVLVLNSCELYWLSTNLHPVYLPSSRDIFPRSWADFPGASVPLKVTLFQMDLKENLSVTITMKPRWIDLCSGKCMYMYALVVGACHRANDPSLTLAIIPIHRGSKWSWKIIFKSTVVREYASFQEGICSLSCSLHCNIFNLGRGIQPKR